MSMIAAAPFDRLSKVMRRTGLALAALVLLAGAAIAEPRVALVIGNARYGGDLGALPNPVNDARLMAKTLKGVGFEVIEAEDADQAQMKRVIQEFGERLAQSGDGATGLFFYAGHGLQVAGTNYLIPVHARIAREPDVDIEAVAVDLVMKQMAFADSAVNIVILDACRNNPLSRGFRTITRGLADPTVRPMGSFIAYSTAPGDVAEDGNGANSPYTTALAAAIAKPGASINDVFQEVRGKVLAATDRKQVPWDSSSLTAPFYFVPAVAAPPANPAPDAQAMELAFWNTIKDSKTPEDYRAYLDKFPDGVFASLARIRAAQPGQAAARVVRPNSDAAAPGDAARPTASAVEDAFWAAVESDGLAEGYQAYLRNYPGGAYAERARARVAALGGAKTAPPAQQAAVTPPPEIVAAAAQLYARDQARLREAPSTDAAVVAALSAGTPLAATGRTADGAWWRVTLADGRAGFIAATVVDTKAPAAPASTTPAPGPEATDEAAVPQGQEHDVCLKDTDSPAANRVVACRRLLAAGIADATDRYNAQLYLGDGLTALGKGDAAIAAYRAAVAIDPNFYGAYYDIGLVHLNAGRYAEARAAFDKAVALNPEDADSRYQRGTVLADLGDYRAARADIEQAIKLKPENTSYLDELAVIHLGEGDGDAAVVAVERALAVDSGYWSSTAMLAYYLAGKFAPAMAQADAGIKAQPDYPYFYLWKALAQKASGDAAGAGGTLADGLKAVGKTDWPVPLLRYVAGQIPEAKLRALAAAKDAKVAAQQLCEVDFYTGEVAYLAGDRAKSQKAMQASIDTRIYPYLELVAAKTRLAQLIR